LNFRHYHDINIYIFLPKDNAEAARLAALAEEEGDDDEEYNDDDDEDEENMEKVKKEVEEKEKENEKEIEKEKAPPPPVIIVTSQEVLDSMNLKREAFQSSIQALEGDITELQNQFEDLTKTPYKTTSMEIAEILIINYFYILQNKRSERFLKFYYRENSSLNVDGMKNLVGADRIINAILFSFELINVRVELEPLDIDSIPPPRCNAFVKCNYFLKVLKYLKHVFYHLIYSIYIITINFRIIFKIDDDKPRKVLEV